MSMEATVSVFERAMHLSMCQRDIPEMEFCFLLVSLLTNPTRRVPTQTDTNPKRFQRALLKDAIHTLSKVHGLFPRFPHE